MIFLTIIMILLEGRGLGLEGVDDDVCIGNRVRERFA